MGAGEDLEEPRGADKEPLLERNIKITVCVRECVSLFVYSKGVCLCAEAYQQPVFQYVSVYSNTMFTLQVKAPKFSTLLIVVERVCMNVFRCAEVDAGARMHACMHLDVAPRCTYLFSCNDMFTVQNSLQPLILTEIYSLLL